MTMTPETDQNRLPGVVPEDDIVDRTKIGNDTVALMDGNGTIHLAKPAYMSDRPRESTPLSPGEQQALLNAIPVEGTVSDQLNTAINRGLIDVDEHLDRGPTGDVEQRLVNDIRDAIEQAIESGHDAEEAVSGALLYLASRRFEQNL